MYFGQLILCYTVFFPEIGGSTLDSHHGFVVEYGMDKDVELGKSYTFPTFPGNSFRHSDFIISMLFIFDKVILLIRIMKLCYRLCAYFWIFIP